MADKDIEALRSPLLLGEDSRRRAPSASGSLRRDVSSRSSIRIANSLRSSENTAYFHDPALPSSAAADDEAEKKGCCGGFCALMDRYPIPFVLGGAAIGVGIGVGLAYWQPANPSAKDVVVQWIGVLGVLFIRALQCIVLPLVFVSVAVAVMDMLALGEAGKVAGFTIGLYIVYTFFAACIGCAMSVAFRQFYVLAGNHAVGIEPEVRLGCDADSYLTKQADGSVACEANGADGNSTLFMLDDVNGYFAKSKAAQGLAQVSLSDSLYEGLFMSFIGPNMFGLFVGGNFLGVIILAAAFGIALTQLSKEMPAGVKWERILIIQVLEELMQVFMMFVKWVIKITPFAIISLIAKAIGGHSDLAGVMEQIGYLVAAVLCGMILQFLVAYIGSYLLIIRKNPLIYFRHMIPAWSVAFASASSAATLPVSIDCAIASGQVPEGVAKFCLPLGATSEYVSPRLRNYTSFRFISFSLAGSNTPQSIWMEPVSK
ncbi:hypothetical protein ACHAWF_009223 [Thalassiosira exigua]